MICKDCMFREVGCHSKCEKYLAEKKAHDELCEVIRQQKQLDADYNGVCFYKVRKQNNKSF